MEQVKIKVWMWTVGSVCVIWNAAVSSRISAPSPGFSQCTAMYGAGAYCKALKVHPSLALLLDVAFSQHSPWKPAAKIK